MSSTISSAIAGTIPTAAEREAGTEPGREQFLDLIQGLDAIVWEVDVPSSSFTFVSQRAEHILGYPVQRWLEEPGFWQNQVVHPADRWAVEFCANATREARDHEFEYRAIRADGGVVWLRELVRVDCDECGRARRLRGVMIDISKEMQAREKLEESEGKLAEAQALAALGSWEWDVMAERITWSDEQFRLHGEEPRPEVTFDWFFSHLYPEDQAWIGPWMERALDTGESFEFPYRILRPDGELRWLYARGKMVMSPEGRPLRMVGTSQDITERRLAEKALRASEESYRAIFQHSSEAIWLHDMETGAMLDVNQAGCEMYGYSYEEMMRLGHDALLYPGSEYTAERVAEYMALAIAGDTPRFEWMGRHQDGSEVWGEVTLRRVTISGKERILASARDIRERKVAEEALRRANEELEQRVAERTSELAMANDALLLRTQELEAIFQALPDLYFRLGADGTILEQRAGRDNGARYPLAADGFPENMVGLNVLDVVPADAVEAMRDALVKVPRSGELACFEFAVQISGAIRHSEARVLPVADGDLIVIVRDITDRKHNERELQRRRAEAERAADALRFQTSLLEAQDHAGIDGILVAHEGRVLRMNRRYADLFDVPQELRAPERCAEMFRWACQQAADPDEYRAIIERVRYDPDATRRDEVLLADGRVLDRYTAPLKSAEGYLYGRLWMLRDITARKQAEQALQEREEHFRRLIENASDMVQLIDAEGRIRYTGPSVYHLLGYTPEEIEGTDPLIYIHPEDRPQTTTALTEMLGNPGTVRVARYRVRHKDGRYRHFEAFARTLSAESAAEGLVVNARDVTERQRVEAELIRQKAYFEGIIDSLDAGVAVFDRTGRFEYVSRSAVSDAELRQWIIGKTNEEYSRRRGLSPEIGGPRQRSVDRALAERKPGEFEQEMRQPDGTTRHMLRRVLPLLDEAGEVARVIGYSVDITERKHAEEKLREATQVAEQARQDAERANRAKSEFLSRMSHELRTPMNSILGFAQLLERTALSPKDTKSVQHILKAGRHLLHLINEVLEIARIEAGRHNFSLEPVRMRHVLQEAVGLVRPLAAQWSVEIDDADWPQDEVFVRADRQRLVQVLLNLLSNAIKYNRPGGRVWLSCGTGEPGLLAVRIEDTGRGIPTDRVDQLFTPFSRLGAEQTEVEGTGLGLALSQRLAEAMGGGLWLEHSSSDGSVFRLDLVLAEDPVARLEVPDAPTALDESAPHREATLLYIEDNLANLSLVETILLSRPRWRTVPALQGRLGLELAYEHLPDLILLDLHLPDVNGEEVLRRLRGDVRTAAIPVVIVSADATPSSIERLRSMGADAYLTKPLDIDEFLETVGRFLPEDA